MERVEITWYLQYFAEELAELMCPLQQVKLLEILSSPASEDFIQILTETLKKDLQAMLPPGDDD